MFSPIVVVIDGSPGGWDALALSSSILNDAHPTLLLVDAMNHPGVFSCAEAADNPDAGPAAKLRHAVTEARASGIRTDVIVADVNPGGIERSVAQLVSDRHARLIVVAGEGPAPVTELLPASLPIRILHATQVPVLIVPSVH